MNQTYTITTQAIKWNIHVRCWLACTTSIFVLTGCDVLTKTLSDFPVLNFNPAQKNIPQVVVQSTPIAQMEIRVRQQINAIRQQQGLNQLRNNEKLAQVARNYSRQMAEQNFFSHTSPQGTTVVQRVHSAGIFYFMVGENLFKGTNLPDPVPSAVQGWVNSPGHRENILRPEFRETGVGVWRKGNTYYFTQLFKW